MGSHICLAGGVQSLSPVVPFQEPTGAAKTYRSQRSTSSDRACVSTEERATTIRSQKAGQMVGARESRPGGRLLPEAHARPVCEAEAAVNRDDGRI
jgi:hypothetical protein